MRAISTGPACSTTAISWVDSACRLEIDARITQVRHSTPGRGETGPSYFLTLTDLNSTNHIVTFGDSYGVFDIAETGDEVTAMIWRGAVVSVTDDTVTTKTLDAPDYAAGMNLGGLVAAALWLLGLTGSALARIRRMPGAVLLNRTATVLVFGGGLFSAGVAGASLVPMGVYDSLILGAVLCGFVLLLLGVGALFKLSRFRRYD